MPFFFSHVTNCFDVNCGPLSDVILPGNPFLVNMSVKQLMIVLVVVELMGIASGHLEDVSMHVSRCLNPPVAIGNGPTKSMATSVKGCVVISLLIIGHGLGVVLSAA